MAKGKGGKRGKAAPKLHAGNHNKAGMMMKHSPKAMRGQGKC